MNRRPTRSSPNQDAPGSDNSAAICSVMGSPQTNGDRPLLPEALDRGAWVHPTMGSWGIWDAHECRPISAVTLPPVRCSGWRLRITSLPERPHPRMRARLSASGSSFAVRVWPVSAFRQDPCCVRATSCRCQLLGLLALICGPWPPRDPARHRRDGIVGVGKHLRFSVPRAIMAFSSQSSI